MVTGEKPDEQVDWAEVTHAAEAPADPLAPAPGSVAAAGKSLIARQLRLLDEVTMALFGVQWSRMTEPGREAALLRIRFWAQGGARKRDRKLAEQFEVQSRKLARRRARGMQRRAIGLRGVCDVCGMR